MALNYDSLTSRINELQAKLPVERSKLASFQASLAAWQAAATQDSANNASAATIEQTSRRIREEQQKVNDQTVVVSTMESELAYSLDLRKKIDDAAATAIANGSTPEAAYQVAIAEVANAETRRKVVMIAGVALLIIGAVVLFIWWRKKGRKLA